MPCEMKIGREKVNLESRSFKTVHFKTEIFKTIALIRGGGGCSKLGAQNLHLNSLRLKKVGAQMRTFAQ